MNDLKNFCVLLITHDDNSYAWDHWYYYIKKYWNFDIPHNFYFLNNNKIMNYPEFKQIIVNDNFWTNRVKKALEQITEKNVLCMFEDHWPKKRINIIKIYNDFLKYDINCLRLEGPFFYYISPNNSYTFDEDNKIITDNDMVFHKGHKSSKWLNSCQPTLWKKSWLLYNLEDNQKHYDFEIKRSNFLNNCDFDPKVYFLDIDWYDEVIYGSKYNGIGIKRKEDRDFYMEQDDPLYLNLRKPVK